MENITVSTNIDLAVRVGTKRIGTLPACGCPRDSFRCSRIVSERKTGHRSSISFIHLGVFILGLHWDSIDFQKSKICSEMHRVRDLGLFASIRRGIKVWFILCMISDSLRDQILTLGMRWYVLCHQLANKRCGDLWFWNSCKRVLL